MEKRKYPRFTVGHAHCNVLSETEVDVLNISAGGVALMADVSLGIDKEYTLRLENKDKSITVRGQVVWSVLRGIGKGPNGEEIPLYEAGMKFTHTDHEKTHDIMDFIEHYKIFRDERPIARFQIKSPDLTILHYPCRCSVSKISLGGMLIRTDRPFTVEETFPLELSLEEDRTIRAYGRVASCLSLYEAGNKVYDVGIEFLDMSVEHLNMLKKFIETLSPS